MEKEMNNRKEMNNMKEMNEIKENINLDLDITYSNDDDYKRGLIKVFNIKIDNLENLECIDIDNDDIFKVISKKITLLKNKIERNPQIITLCMLSAKMMLSEDLEIGLLLLHSYHSFELFYQLYCHLLKTNEIKSDVYEKLLEKIK